MNVAYFCRSVACEANTAVKAESEIKLKETSIDSIELNELSTIEIAGNFVKINDYLYMHLISSHQAQWNNTETEGDGLSKHFI